MIQVPFDIELAKKITSGDIPGKVVTRDGKNARIVCFDKKNPDYPIVGLVIRENIEVLASFTSEGIYSKGCSGKNDLMLEIPEYFTYKDGDIIYGEVDNGGGDYCKWFSIVKEIGCILDKPYVVSYVDYIWDSSYNCGSLEYMAHSDNFDLIRLATEEEKVRFAKRLQENKDSVSDEYLEKYFGIKESPKVSNSEKFGKKEELAQAYTDMEVKRYHEHSGVIEKYGMERARMTSEHESWELTDAYKSGWDTCLKHLASIPWDEAMNEIVNYCKGKEN